MSASSFADVGIELRLGAAGEIDTICPQCSHTRKKSRQRCLSVNTESGAYYCHHCGWAGAIGRNRTGYGTPLRRRVASPAPPRTYIAPTPPPAGPLPTEIVRWFATRGIPEAILIRAGITAGQEFCPQLGRSILAIRFPYLRAGALVNIKYRTLDKHFWMVRGARRILYGLDDILGAETVCLVEGEVDALSIATAGGPPTVSVPDGAPPPDATHCGNKFSFLDELALARLRAASTVLIASDMDAPGVRLAEELAARVGRAGCRRVAWPEGCKDANDVLVRLGPAAVLASLTHAPSFRASTERADGSMAPYSLRLRSRRARLHTREAVYA
jgi:twinkle protein